MDGTGSSLFRDLLSWLRQTCQSYSCQNAFTIQLQRGLTMATAVAVFEMQICESGPRCYHLGCI